MRRGRAFQKHIRRLAALALILLGSLFLSACGQDPDKLPYAKVMEKAAQLHARCTEKIREEREARGLALSEEDKLGIGLLGEDFTAIMTTSAGLPEKRTSQLPDFAALVVKYFKEAGLKKGDAVGANFSGSYPGFNLAVLCAAEVMGLDLRYTTSVGSSAYGANLPEYTFPEMAKTLYDAKLITRMPVLITLGGKGDMGLNMMGYVLEEPEDIQKIEEMKARLIAAGLGWAEIENFSQDIALHEELYGEIKAFVNAGGNGLGLGSSEDSFMLKAGNGLLEPQTVEITAHSGLTERYLAKGLPTIHLLAVKKLCEENGIPFDPDGIPEIGTSGVYYRSKTP